MNDEDYSTIYDTIQNERTYEVPDQPEENESPHYDDVQEYLRPENDLYATQLNAYEYDFVSVCTINGEETSLASAQSEDRGYLLPDEIYSELQEAQPGELQEDRGISMEGLYSPTQDQQPCPEELQENGSVMKEDLPSPSSFTIQHSKAFSTSKYSSTCYSDAEGLEEKEGARMNPEICLFVKVRSASDRYTLCMRILWLVFYFALNDQGKIHNVMVLGSKYIFKSRSD